MKLFSLVRRSGSIARKTFRAGLFLCVLGNVSSPALQAQAATGSASAKTPPDALPSAGQILSRYIEAVGGRAAWLKLTSRVSSGAIKVGGLSATGTVEIREKAPNRIVTVIKIGDTSFRQGFDGKIGWTEDPQNGLRQQAGAELAETRREADFYSPLNLRNHYAKFSVEGAEKVDGRDAYVLQATAAGDDQPDKIYFDSQAGVLVRIVGHHHAPSGNSWFVEDLGDYREIDGVKLPFTIAQTSMDSEFTVEIGEVQHNVALEDSQFSKPAVQ
jgi:zinc protease